MMLAVRVKQSGGGSGLDAGADELDGRWVVVDVASIMCWLSAMHVLRFGAIEGVWVCWCRWFLLDAGSLRADNSDRTIRTQSIICTCVETHHIAITKSVQIKNQYL